MEQQERLAFFSYKKNVKSFSSNKCPVPLGVFVSMAGEGERERKNDGPRQTKPNL